MGPLIVYISLWLVIWPEGFRSNLFTEWFLDNNRWINLSKFHWNICEYTREKNSSQKVLKPFTENKWTAKLMERILFGVWIDELQFRIIITVLVPDKVFSLVWQYRHELYDTEVYKHAKEKWLCVYFTSSTVPQTSWHCRSLRISCVAVDRN